MRLNEEEKQEVAALVYQWIISEDDPGHFIETLDAMFDSWVLNHIMDGAALPSEPTVLIHYRNLQQLMRGLEDKKMAG